MQTPHVGRTGWQYRWRYRLITWCTIAVLTGLSGIASAQTQGTYPAFQDPYVNDYGDVLTLEDEANVSRRLEQFQSETGVHAVLLTVNSISDYSTRDNTIESFATNLFNTWGIGDATRNDGILVLVAPGDRQVRIEIGAGYDRQGDRLAQIIIDDTMLPRFRDGQIAAGTVAGVEAVTQYFALDAPAPLPSRQATDTSGNAGPWWQRLITVVLLPLTLVGGILRMIYGWWNRQRSRQCPTCQLEMRRLAESEDDRYLEPGERREESLRSVDYDVWLCPSCGYHTTLPYKNLFSRHKNCANCSHKTLFESRRTLVRPTYTSTGTAEITQDCKHCGHHNVYTRTIPRKKRSSSSRGSSGGGRSSGGGASGSW
ncbi:MAG: TPM domain-containing protein [Cyanobacteria bacterium P01_D01_bin.6]